MPEKLFISYARHDGKDHAIKLDADLKSAGHDTWYDNHDIQSGLAWQKAIQDGIDNCSVFLLLMTPASLTSNNCFAEWSRALNKKKPLIPLRMKPTDGADPVEPDQLPLYIETLQYINFADDWDAGWKTLTDRLGTLSDPDFQTAQEQSRRKHSKIPVAVTGKLLTDPDAVPRLPDVLIGRDDLKAIISNHMADNTVIDLHGIGGVGKSALVADVIADQLDDDDPHPVLWLEVGNAGAERVFAEIGQVFNQQKAMINARGDDDKINLTRELMKAHNVATLVIDDAWNPAVLSSLVKTIPRRRGKIPVLVTSRQRQGHITGGEQIALDSLSKADARKLLDHHAKRDDMTGADDLCATAYYHPFLLEIAGRLLAHKNMTPQRLLADMPDLTHARLPEGVAEAGRENMAILLSQSLEALPDDFTRAVFMGFGHLPTTTATPELLTLLLRDDIANMNDYFYEHEFDDEPAPLHDLPNLPAVKKALDALVTHGLVTRIPAEQRGGYPYTVERFRLHDIAHAYATATADTDRAVTACVVYTWRHNSPSYPNFSALRSELDNLMEASVLAMRLERWQDTERFAWNLANVSYQSRFLSYQGYYSEAVILLTQASTVAEGRDDKRAQGKHLGNLGNAYDALGQYDTAIDYHKQALDIDREIGNRQGEGIVLGNLGNAYDSLGQYETAIDYHKQALEIGDRNGEGRHLGNLGNAYDSLGQYDTAIDYHKQYLDISHEIGNRQGEGIALGNLGTVYDALGQYETAIDYHKRALDISWEIGDRNGEGRHLGNLGVAYKNLGQYETAIDYYQQAMTIRRQLGDRNGLANALYNLGLLYNNLDRYAEAIPLLAESLALVKDMGQLHYVADTESQLERARRGADAG